jgi:hypothetical protein
VAGGRRAVGASVPAGDVRHGTAALVLGMLSRNPGVHAVSAIEVGYHVGLRRYRTSIDDVAAVLCVPRHVYSAALCPPSP